MGKPKYLCTCWHQFIFSLNEIVLSALSIAKSSTDCFLCACKYKHTHMHMYIQNNCVVHCTFGKSWQLIKQIFWIFVFVFTYSLFFPFPLYNFNFSISALLNARMLLYFYKQHECFVFDNFSAIYWLVVAQKF